MAVIKKDDILRGINDPELIYINALDAEIPLRPLSKKEINDINKIEARGYGDFQTNETANRDGQRQVKGGLDSEISTKGIINLEKSTEATYQGKLAAIHLSINNGHQEADQWSKKDVESLPNDVFEEIFVNVQNISGIDVDQKELEKFRKDISKDE